MLNLDEIKARWDSADKLFRAGLDVAGLYAVRLSDIPALIAEVERLRPSWTP